MSQGQSSGGGVSDSASEETVIRGAPETLLFDHQRSGRGHADIKAFMTDFRRAFQRLGQITMNTVILNAQTEIREAVAMAVEVLNRQDLVALPTETVYGLAGDALQPEAVTKIFETKDMPSFDPLIVHIENQSWLAKLTRVPKNPSPVLERLMDKNSPGRRQFCFQNPTWCPSWLRQDLPSGDSHAGPPGFQGGPQGLWKPFGGSQREPFRPR